MPVDDVDDSDATSAQLRTLQELVVTDADLDGLTYSDAEELIAELQAQREDAGRIERE